MTILACLWLVSCTTSHRLASRYVTKKQDVHVLLIAPLEMNKGFDKTRALPGGNDNRQGQDTLTARLLPMVNDSVFMKVYTDALVLHLKRLRVNVKLLQPGDSLLQAADSVFLFRIAQMELLEFPDVFIAEQFYHETTFQTLLPRTNLEISSWFEFLAPGAGLPEVLYSAQQTSDYFSGRFNFTIRAFEPVFNYVPYYLDEADIYNLAAFAGEKNAGYIFDHLMNRYVEKKLGRRPARHFLYDPYYMELRRSGNDRFIRIE